MLENSSGPTITTENSSNDDEYLLKQRRRVNDSQLKLPLLLSTPNQWPIVYSDNYNITCYGIEKLHPFDSEKWRKVFNILKDHGWLTNDNIYHPKEALEEDLLILHEKKYLKLLKCPCLAAKAIEVGVVAFLPSFLINKKLLQPMRYHVGGTVLSSYLALKHGWSINIGGGFHHASSNSGGGFCIYNDLSIAILFLLNDSTLKKKIKKVMIVDLDAHQGNGHERDFKTDKRVYIFDMFNYKIYPRDQEAKEGISKAIRLTSYTEDREYLNLLKKNLPEAITEFQPDIIFYNAGTDCYEDDPLGCLSLTKNGIIERDEYVFKTSRKNKMPIIMVTSGGYTNESAGIIAASLINLKEKNIIKIEPGFDDENVDE
uniref:Histone deacetylase domain-containing protein n=1 Tax=Panagrolaimus sp. JU765 TaxID=591449 RepID=A0AC34QUF8_9BILA